MAGKLIVHGLDQTVVGGTFSVLIDGSKVADVKIKDSVTIPIAYDCTRSIKCGVNFSKPKMEIPDGMVTEVQCVYHRLKGNFTLELVSQTPYDAQAEGAAAPEVEQPVYNIGGVRGRWIKIYPNRCIITTSITIGSILTRNASDGEKTIYFIDCVGVQFKKAGLQIGYLQFETASSATNNRADNFFNENSFTFDTKTVSNEKMQEVADYVRKQIAEIKAAKIAPQNTTVVQQTSAADELKKFKELLDMGVINQEEFDAKKKQLLGL